MRTTRGDRLFIALMVSACLCIAWIIAIPISMWWLLLISVLLVIALLRWG
jgi:predicted small integral membrane protein